MEALIICSIPPFSVCPLVPLSICGIQSELREGAWCTRGSPVRSVNGWVRMSDRSGRGRGSPRPTHEITIVRGQGRGGVYAEDRSIRVLGVEIPSVYLLPRRDEYTRVYTTVYPRVHNSIHACTLPRSKYILCRARSYVYSLGIMPRIFSGGLRLPGI